MIHLQIIEKQGTHLFKILVDAMRTGDLHTFSVQKRGKKVTHAKFGGWMNWYSDKGLILCEIISPQKPSEEWKFLSAFLGRLADKFSGYILNISIQFPDAQIPVPKKRKRK